MFIEFTEDCTRMNIINRKPVRKNINDKSMHPKVLGEDGLKKLSKDQKISYDNYMLEGDPEFQNVVSSASCYVSEIKDFIYGGMSSRFWMLRKHFNSLSLRELKSVPFYSWQCITLILEHRDVDLVITSTKDMELLLKFLIHSLYTIDGSRGSATALLEALQK